MKQRDIQRLDSGILIPGGAADLTIRDRIAPRPKVGAGIGGWFQLELIDRQGRLAWDHQQHNLFLDSGLDRIGQSVGGASGAVINASGDLTHFAVGTGSAPPDITDTTLDNELVRTTETAPGAFDGVRRVADGVYEVERTFEFGFAQANGNLTEVGCGWGAGPANLWMRELIRDSGGTPITLTKTSDFLLRCKYILRFTLSPVVATPGSFSVAGWGTLNGVYMFRGGAASTSSTGQTDYRAFRKAASAGADPRGLVSATAASTTYSATGNLGSMVDSSSSSVQASAFVPGVWERNIAATFGVSQGNGVVATIALHGQGSYTGSNTVPGFFFLIDANDRPTKDNEHILTIDRIIGVTWGRA